MICINKYNISSARQVTKDEAENYAKKELMLYFEVSALTNTNINYMLYSSILTLPFFEGLFEQNKNLSKKELMLELRK